ncbi:GRIP and coiled-coil domain-containing protein 1 [Engraulis encrasicolus]|uniref:GRIP and coiled-coil domain-containing protein 1 n=1 Tax=Engraulis encrasicolus TaxID=184585 RepID=UPI002FD610B0
MDKLGMAFGGGPSKKELQETIEAQKKQLVQYQTRFKDVVRAYKSLMKEKEALEASLKVLTVSQEVDLGHRDNQDPSTGGGGADPSRSPMTSDLGDDRSSLHSEDSLDTAASVETAASVSSSTTRGEGGDEEHQAQQQHSRSGSLGDITPSLGTTSTSSLAAAVASVEEAGGPESGGSSSSSVTVSSGVQDQQLQPPQPSQAQAQAQPPPQQLTTTTGTGASVESDRRFLQLKAQLSTLTSSLTTVTQEKSRMEASFQADKRKMKHDMEELQRSLEEQQKQHDADMTSLQEQFAESKARVITQQHERAQEQGDHALMLRELQKLLQEERSHRQDAELRLEDAQQTLMETMQAADRSVDMEARLREVQQEREEMRRSLQTDAADRSVDMEARLKEVQQEREEMRRSLQAAEEERSKPHPLVEELQKEMGQLKTHYTHQLQQEIRKSSQAEERLVDQSRLEEGRVASLELRVSELSELLGACERARQKDQQTAQRLRERVLQLDTENKTLAIAATAPRTGLHTLNLDEANLDVTALRDKMEVIKKLLKMATQNQKSSSGTQQQHQQGPLEIEKLGVGGGERDEEEEEEEGEGEEEGKTKVVVEESDGDRRSALYYQQELRQVREEFERYKVRAQVVLKNKNAKDGSQAKELEDARDQLAELKEKYINLRIHADEAEAAHRRTLEDKQQGALTIQQQHKQELERVEAGHRDSFVRLEAELHKQRERTMALLAEKETEIEKLRSHNATATATASILGLGAGHRRTGSSEMGGTEIGGFATSPGTGAGSGEEVEWDSQAREESEYLTQALRLAGPNEPTLLLYAEQLARKEVENGALRRQKRRLEEDLHQLQGRLIANGERHDEEVTCLREELEQRVRDLGRDGANLEYVKNVVFRYLTLQDSRGRQQTLGAILTILHFSPQEKQQVIKQQGQGWWTQGKR